MFLRPQRGTDPYSANVIASMTVDLPDPVGPTSAKKSASVKSIVAASLNEAKPFMSSTIGRMVCASFGGFRGSPPGLAQCGSAGGLRLFPRRGDLLVQPREQRRDPFVADLLGGAVVSEKLVRGPHRAGHVRAAVLRGRRGEL